MQSIKRASKYNNKRVTSNLIAENNTDDNTPLAWARTGFESEWQLSDLFESPGKRAQ